MTEGIVNLGDLFANEIGFTADRFDGYLWRSPNAVMISLIFARQPGQGHFSALCRAIWDRGLTVKVPTALGQMPSILMHLQFTLTIENGDLGPCRVWVKAP